MTKRVTIVDFGIGNLFSVMRAVEVTGGEDIRVSGRAEDIVDADKLILPGVGAFKDGMLGLRERGLLPHILSAVQRGKPLLGICLGMQLLATTSEEFGLHSGLALIPGKVKPMPRVSVHGDPLKVPYIGWSPLILSTQGLSEVSCLAKAHNNSVYLVHSYYFEPDDPKNILANYSFGGHLITAAVRHNNITGVQFHPEKSGAVGLEIIREFICS